MSATHATDSTVSDSPKLYLAFDLGWTSWNLAFTTAMAQKPRLRTIPARDLDALQREIQIVGWVQPPRRRKPTMPRPCRTLVGLRRWGG